MVISTIIKKLSTEGKALEQISLTSLITANVSHIDRGILASHKPTPTDLLTHDPE